MCPRPRRCARGNLGSLPDCLEARHRPVENAPARQAVASQALVSQALASPRALHHSRRRSSAVSGPRGPSSIRASSRNR